jgi:hypothetical protein
MMERQLHHQGSVGERDTQELHVILRELRRKKPGVVRLGHARAPASPTVGALS